MVAVRPAMAPNGEEVRPLASDQNIHYLIGRDALRRVRRRSGQAMTEFVIVLLALILIIVAMVEFLPIFLENFGLLKEVREEAGRQSLTSESGMATADRKDEFSFEVPGILPGDKFTSGHFSEKLSLPAINLACDEAVRIPDIAGLQETLRYENRNGTSAFRSGLITLPPEQALARARGTLTGAGWIAHPIEAHDALVFSSSDERAVAAVHACLADDGSGLTTLTVVARAVGGEL